MKWKLIPKCHGWGVLALTDLLWVRCSPCQQIAWSSPASCMDTLTWWLPGAWGMGRQVSKATKLCGGTSRESPISSSFIPCQV